MESNQVMNGIRILTEETSERQLVPSIREDTVTQHHPRAKKQELLRQEVCPHPDEWQPQEQ